MKRHLTFTLATVPVLGLWALAHQPAATQTKSAPAKTEHKTTSTQTKQEPAKTEPKTTTHKAEAEPLKLNKKETVALQGALTKAGYYKGKADSVINPETKLALKKYQRDNKLHVTSEPTAETLNKLGLAYTAPTTKPAEQPMEPPAQNKAAAKKSEPAPKKPNSN